MSDTTENVLALMRGEGRGPRAALARFGLWLLSLIYGVGIRIYWWCYRFGILRRVRLGPVVVSIGNMTTGGTGKTTTVQHVVRALSASGLKVAVLSYGYRSASKETVGIVSDGKSVLMPAAEAGDEAVLLAESLPGVPVLICRRRVISGAEAERLFQPDVLVCDDAFQYWRLTRDVDIVLMDAVNPWGYGYMLPRGLLREPKSHISRADAILITHADLAAPDAVAALKGQVSDSHRPVWTARHAPSGLSRLDGKPAGGLETLRDTRVLAVSSLGDPASYEATLRGAGSDVEPMRFADHHRYTAEDVRRVDAEARGTGRRIVTTAKDAVKVREQGAGAEWLVLDIELAVDDQGSFDKWLTDKVHARKRNG